MGYVTHYKLAMASMGDVDPPSVVELRAIRVDDGYSDVGELVEHGDSMKWYEHEQEMRALSARFPSILFTLDGHGEEAGDVWRKYFLGGRCQSAPAVLTIAPFDAELLA